MMADNVQQAVPSFMVESMEASLRFYVDGLSCRTRARGVGVGGDGLSTCRRNTIGE